jgi:CRP-like cAMP-binding protein
MERKNSKVSGTVVILSWMITELNLKGNELLVYSIIYSFTNTDGDTWYRGSKQYLADWCGCSLEQVTKILDNFIKRGILEVKEVGGYNEYRVKE